MFQQFNYIQRSFEKLCYTLINKRYRVTVTHRRPPIKQASKAGGGYKTNRNIKLYSFDQYLSQSLWI